jgi:phosphatidylethanolamine/phosphatidyl-N-methylethanolamine N-methyltransferase
VIELGLNNVEGLEVMDAEHLRFPDASFDVVVAQYVITAVPDPEAALDEFARVLRPGGEIVILSRVGAEAGLRRAIERWFAPAARKLGWRTEFAWERYAAWATHAQGCGSSSARQCRRRSFLRSDSQGLDVSDGEFSNSLRDETLRWV